MADFAPGTVLANDAFAVGTAVYVRQTRIHAIVSALSSKGGKVQYHRAIVPGLNQITGNFFADPKSVNLHDVDVTDEDVRALRRLSRVENLYLPGTIVDRVDLETISEMKALRRLALWRNGNITDRCIDSLLKLEHLEVLDIHDTRVSPSEVPRLLELPALKHLIFSTDFYGDASRWLTQEGIDQLVRIRSTPVGHLFCRELTDEGMAKLKLLDTTRLTSLTIRDSKITGAGLQELRGVRTKRLDIQGIPLSDEDVQQIPWDEINHCVLGGTRATLAGLAECLGDRCQAIDLTAGDLITLHSSEHVRASATLARFFPSERTVSLDALQKLKQLKTLTFAQGQYPGLLYVLKQLNPRIKLHAFLPESAGPEFWTAIRQMDQLTGLTVRAAPPGIQFSEKHQLGTLTITFQEGAPMTDEFFRQISKLEQLRFLWLKRHAPIGAEVRHLSRLNNLRTLRVDGMTDDGLRYARDLHVEYLDINDGRHLTEKGLRHLEGRSFRFELKGRRYAPDEPLRPR